MSLLTAIVLGAIAGWIASLIMKSPNGIVMDIVLGIIGAFVGSLIMEVFGQSGAYGFNLYSIIVSVVGAIVVIALGRMFTRQTI